MLLPVHNKFTIYHDKKLSFPFSKVGFCGIISSAIEKKSAFGLFLACFRVEAVANCIVSNFIFMEDKPNGKKVLLSLLRG